MWRKERYMLKGILATEDTEFTEESQNPNLFLGLKALKP
jgi:hypothetical protein